MKNSSLKLTLLDSGEIDLDVEIVEGQEAEFADFLLKLNSGDFYQFILSIISARSSLNNDDVYEKIVSRILSYKKIHQLPMVTADKVLK